MVTGSSAGGKLRREERGKPIRMVAGPNWEGTLKSYMVALRILTQVCEVAQLAKASRKRSRTKREKKKKVLTKSVIALRATPLAIKEKRLIAVEPTFVGNWGTEVDLSLGESRRSFGFG
jgi:hypothetical protein